MFRKQGSRRSNAAFACGGSDKAETRTRRHPSSRISVEMLSFGIERSTVNGLYTMKLSSAGGPKARGKSERQRTNGDDDHYSTPSTFTNTTIS